MKNLHLLPTEKPSRLIIQNGNRLILGILDYSIIENRQHIYITSDEEITGFENNIWVIKGDRIFLWQNTMALVSNNKPKIIILTTDQDLINDGVQSIDDEFLGWFVKNPSCEEVKIKRDFADEGIKGITYYGKYFLIIPKEEPKQETLEEVALKLYPIILEDGWDKNKQYRDEWINGAKWQYEIIRNDAINFAKWLDENAQQREYYPMRSMSIEQLFEQFKNK